jgi:membrane dipeptidase
MLIVDAHQDLAWNMLTFERDYTRSAAETRRLERGTEIPNHNGDTLLGWPDYQRGRVAVIFATMFAAPIRRRLGTWDVNCYANPDEAHQRYSEQLDAYHRLLEQHSDKFRLLLTRADLEEVLTHWQSEQDGAHPVGLTVLMEGGEAVREMGELEMWWQRGVRIIGPAWAGTRFCGGTREPGALTKEGFALLEGMAGLGFILDISHMDQSAVLQALDTYSGTLVASHSNAAAALKNNSSNRHLSDRVIQGLIERDGVIGIVPFNGFLDSDWRPSDSRQGVTLHHVITQIDHICQIAGDSRHVGLGSDFDGGFGLQMVPDEIDTIADLSKLSPLLREKGYTEADISAIMADNWIRKLENNLPEK